MKKVFHWLKRMKYRLFGRWCKPLDVTALIVKLPQEDHLWKPIGDAAPILNMLNDGWKLVERDGRSLLFPPGRKIWEGKK